MKSSKSCILILLIFHCVTQTHSWFGQPMYVIQTLSQFPHIVLCGCRWYGKLPNIKSAGSFSSLLKATLGASLSYATRTNNSVKTVVCHAPSQSFHHFIWFTVKEDCLCLPNFKQYACLLEHSRFEIFFQIRMQFQCYTKFTNQLIYQHFNYHIGFLVRNSKILWSLIKI